MELLLLLRNQVRPTAQHVLLSWFHMCQNGTDLGDHGGRARFGRTPPLDSLPALGILLTWKLHALLRQRKGMFSLSTFWLRAGGDSLPRVSTGKAVG